MHPSILLSLVDHVFVGSTFSAGGFKSLGKKQPTQMGSETTEKPEVSTTHEETAADETAVFEFFKGIIGLEKHLSSEKCRKSL